VRDWTAMRLVTRILYPFLRLTASRIAVLGARSAPKRYCRPAKGEGDIKGEALGWFCVVILAAALTAVSLPVPAAGQAYLTESSCPDNHTMVFHRCAVEAAQTFTPPRTPDGRPDFGGFWRTRIGVAPFEDLEEHPRTPDDGGGPSAIVDPPGGRVPMQPWADARRKENAAKYLHHEAGCFLSGVPATMYMTSLYQFMQGPDRLVIQTEEHHAYRVIPLGTRPRLGANIRLWQGDPHGRWEGNTLVIETTNLNGMPWLDQRGRFVTEEARVVERLTLVDVNTLHYQATVQDANVYTRPFTIATAFRRNTERRAEFWEEACFENNEELMQTFRRGGLGIYSGIGAAEARELRRAWESRGARQ